MLLQSDSKKLSLILHVLHPDFAATANGKDLSKASRETNTCNWVGHRCHKTLSILEILSSLNGIESTSLCKGIDLLLGVCQADYRATLQVSFLSEYEGLLVDAAKSSLSCRYDYVVSKV